MNPHKYSKKHPRYTVVFYSDTWEITDEEYLKLIQFYEDVHTKHWSQVIDDEVASGVLIVPPNYVRKDFVQYLVRKTVFGFFTRGPLQWTEIPDDWMYSIRDIPPDLRSL